MAQISLNLNGTAMECEVDESSLLSTFLREDCGLTGTHIGCDTSQCGASRGRIDSKFCQHGAG
jgi:carbon-monoxide dehydrogenase small subunit